MENPPTRKAIPFAPLSETTMAREVFAPLWQIVDCAAIVHNGYRPGWGAALADLFENRRSTLDRIERDVATVGRFGPDAMAILPVLGGWQSGPSRPDGDFAVFLVLAAECLVASPPDPADTDAVRRLVGYALDIQLPRLVDALVGAALGRGDPATAADPILGVLRGVCDLLGLADPASTCREAVRWWRVIHLPRVLRPDSPCQPGYRTALRDLTRRLEAAVAIDRQDRP